MKILDEYSKYYYSFSSSSDWGKRTGIELVKATASASSDIDSLISVILLPPVYHISIESAARHGSNLGVISKSTRGI